MITQNTKYSKTKKNKQNSFIQGKLIWRPLMGQYSQVPIKLSHIDICTER